MRLNAYSDYALRVLMHAALRAPERTTVDDVAQSYGISRHLLVKIVHDLGRCGYLSTHRGVGGGFTLAMPTTDISLAEIVHLGEGTIDVIDCKDKAGKFCRIFPSCRLKGVLDEAAQAFFATLAKFTLADLVENSSSMKKSLSI